jgi:hypothetical protein
MRSYSTKTNRTGFKGDTLIADVNIVTAGGEILTGLKAQRDVAAPGCAAKGIKTGGCVVVSATIVYERLNTVGRVAVSVVVLQRRVTGGCVVLAGKVARERTGTAGRVVAASSIV